MSVRAVVIHASKGTSGEISGLGEACIDLHGRLTSPRKREPGLSSSSFQGSVPALIGALGRPDFHERLDAALREPVPFNLSCVFAYSSQERPRLVHDGLNDVAPARVMTDYLNGGYLLDCVYTACKRGLSGGLYRLHDIAPDAFFEGPYFNSPEIHPCISLESGALAEEIVFIVPDGGGQSLAYSLLRSNGCDPFSAREFSILGDVAPTVGALLARHGAEPMEPRGDSSSAPTGPGPTFESFARDRLSHRERAVVRLVLEGHSTPSIALTLGIAEGTVKNHRKNIHARLGISSQAELFALFLRHVRGT